MSAPLNSIWFIYGLPMNERQYQIFTIFTNPYFNNFARLYKN